MKHRKRLLYLLTFMFFVTLEILIGAFVHDSFIRPYVGDAIVVIVLYCMVRIIIPEKAQWLPIAIFLFAVFVEILQGINITGLLEIQNGILKIALGSTFDVLDIVSYATGSLFLVIYESILFIKNR